MTVYYVDLVSGNDTTGDGTAGNPYKTISKGTTGLSGGDECRVAKTTAPTALSGTLTFTNGSTSAATSVDLTGELAAGDIIGSNQTGEGWWVISSLNSTTITLTYEYWSGDAGLTGVAITGYKLNPLVESSYQTIAAHGTSAASRLKISGGWNLTGTPAQDGITCISRASAYWMYGNGKNYSEISNFNIVSNHASSLQVLSVGSGWYVHDIYFVRGNTGSALYFYSSHLYENIYVTPGNATNSTYTSSINNSKVKNLKIYTPAVNCNAINMASNNARVYFEGVRVYNVSGSGIGLVVSTSSCFIYGFDCYFHADSASDSAISCGGRNCAFEEFEITGFEKGFYGSITHAEFAVINPTFNSVTTPFDLTTSLPVESPGILISDYDVSGTIYNQMRTVRGLGTKDTSGARSGSMINVTGTSTSYFSTIPVGEYVVEDAGSDITLGIYLKQSASGTVNEALIFGRCGGYMTESNVVTASLSTSYQQFTVTIPSIYLTVGRKCALYVTVRTADSAVYIDDFSASQ